MLAEKRKRTVTFDSKFEAELSAHSDINLSDDEVDISSALTGKRARMADPANDGDEELNEFIQASIMKRDTKGGVDVVKNAKGKNKLVKGELGGGSFQSMGKIIQAESCVVPLMSEPRSSPFTITVLDSAGLSDTNANPTVINTCPSC